MTDRSIGISDEDLSDYLDGRGDPQLRLRVAAAIERDCAVASRFRAFKAHDDELRRLGADILAEPVPERLQSVLQQAQGRVGERKVVRTRPPWRLGLGRAAQLAAVLAVGIAIGWGANLWSQDSPEDLLDPFIREAVLSHDLFLASGSFEGLGSESAQANVSAIDTPFMTPVRLPKNLGAGYRPIMLRSVQGQIGAALQVAYVHDDGDWVSLMVRRHSDQDDVPVRFRKDEGRSVLYWLDGPLVYALVGAGDEESLRRLARDLYAAPAVGGAWSDDATRPTAYVFD